MTLDADLPSLLHPFARPAASRESFVEIVAGAGAEVTDREGRTYIDALGSLWYCNVGHGRPEMAAAIAEQMGRLEVFHTFDRFTNPPADALAERLARMAPMPGSRVFLTSGGSESVETAIKLARIAQTEAGHPERTVVISRHPSYHGVTYGAMTATGLSGNQEGFGPLLPDMVQVPYDDVEALDALAEVTESRIAAVIAEPVVGAGGVYPPPPGYLAALRERCDRWGAYLILDEVICGFGRLGAWFGAEHFGVRPDMITFAKGVTSGYLPCGGVLVGPAVRGPLEADPTFVLKHGYTYSGHPLPAVAALANLDIIEKEGLLDRAEGIGEQLGTGLGALVDGEEVVDVRGTMGIWALALGPKLQAPILRDSLLNFGVIARPIGTATLAFCPPLVISDDQLQRCIEGTRLAIGEVAELLPLRPSGPVPAPYGSHAEIASPCRRHPRAGDDDGVEGQVHEIGPLLSDPRRQPVVGELARDAGLCERVVWVEREKRLEVVLEGIDPVGAEEDQPVRRPCLAVLVGGPPEHSRQAARRSRGAEDRREELVLVRPLARPLLRLALREVPVRTRLEVATLPGHRRAVGRVEIDAPPRDAGAKLVRRRGEGGLL